jgi:heme exporter protein C
MLAIIGVIDLPIIHYSVYWWHSLHQGSTVLGFHRPAIAKEMLFPLLAMMGAMLCYFLAVLMMRVRKEILIREQQTQWVRQLIGVSS